MNNQLTIVIPCKNEGRGITDMLKLLIRQHVDCLIVIADSSDDEVTPLLIKKYQLKSSLSIRIVKGGVPSVARNNGAKYVKTPYVLFLDADVYISGESFLKDCLVDTIAGDYDLITCKFKTLTGKYNWVYRLFDLVQQITSKVTPFAVGGFMLFKTETFNKLGGFRNEDLVAEDYHLSSKIKPRKFKILNKFVYTTARRFENKGVWYMFKLAWKTFLNRNNPEFYKKDHNYWT